MRGPRLRYLVGADNIVWEQMACLALYPNHKIWKLFFSSETIFLFPNNFFGIAGTLKKLFRNNFFVLEQI